MEVITPRQVKEIVDIPLIAWPTVVLLLSCMALELFVLVQLHYGAVSHRLALTVNTLVIYAVFTPMHDASHGAVASRQLAFLNKLVGTLAGFCFPVPFPAFKHIHLMHHKHTNEDADPDKWAGTGPTYLLPLRWLTVELKYYAVYLPKLFSRPTSEAVETVTILAVIIVSIWGLSYSGYGHTILWGWILPGRLATAMLAYFFDYLPHRPHSMSKSVNPYVATNVTSLVGENTAPLTWPLLHQNYHNIHHLAPYIPFYEYSTVWHQLRKDLMARGTQVKPVF